MSSAWWPAPPAVCGVSPRTLLAMTRLYHTPYGINSHGRSLAPPGKHDCSTGRRDHAATDQVTNTGLVSGAPAGHTRCSKTARA